MAHYAALPVAYRTCRHAVGDLEAAAGQLELRGEATLRLTVYPPADCPMCAGTGFAPIRWTVQLLPDGTQVGSHGSRGAAEAAARLLNAQL